MGIEAGVDRESIGEYTGEYIDAERNEDAKKDMGVKVVGIHTSCVWCL